MHASSWLGYSWEFADIADSSTVQPQGSSDGCGIHVGGIVSRREKFRLVAGPSREELLWMQILSILREISVPQWPCLEASVSILPPLSSAEGNGTDENKSSMASLNSRASGELCFQEQLESVSWPFAAVGDIGNIPPFKTAWETVPESADPMRGSGYKVASSAIRVQEQQIHSSHGEDEGDDPDRRHSCMGRAERKRLQVENIASALSSFQLKAGSKIVDFGCGSGALTLPLAALFPEFAFVGVDFKRQSITLLEERARRANLCNVAAFHGRIELFSEPFDACVALHACGIATDLALLQALKHEAAYVMSPCCVGKLQIPIQQVIHNSAQHMQSQPNFGSVSNSSSAIDGTHSSNIDSPCKNFTIPSRSLHSTQIELEGSKSNLVNGTEKSSALDHVFQHTEGPFLKDSMDCISLGLAYPRSEWLRSCISENEFQVLARAADWSSYDHESPSSRLHSLCKVVLELDRNEASQELGYSTGLFSLSNEKAGTVGLSHILVGQPQNFSTKPS